METDNTVYILDLSLEILVDFSEELRIFPVWQSKRQSKDSHQRGADVSAWQVWTPFPWVFHTLSGITHSPVEFLLSPLLPSFCPPSLPLPPSPSSLPHPPSLPSPSPSRVTSPLLLLSFMCTIFSSPQREGTSLKELPPTDWCVNMPLEYFLDWSLM